MQLVDISIIDSRDDNKAVYVVVDNCTVKIKKVKLNDICYIMKVLGDTCHIELDTKGCQETGR